MASTVGSRLAYEKAKQAIQNAGISVGTAVLSQSYLRLEVPLSTNQTLYQFPVLVNDVSSTGNAGFATEIAWPSRTRFMRRLARFISLSLPAQPQPIFNCVRIPIRRFLPPLTRLRRYLIGITQKCLSQLTTGKFCPPGRCKTTIGPDKPRKAQR